MASLVIDFASTDGVTPPDLAKAKAAGARCFVPRAIYGRAYGNQAPVYKDPVWQLNADRIKASGAKRASYILICVPRKGMVTPDPEVQIQAFLDYAKLERPTPGGYCGDYVGFMDVEEASDILDANGYYDWIHRAAVYFKSKTGSWPGLYDSKRVWVEYLSGHIAGDLGNSFPWYAKPWPKPPRSPVDLTGDPSQTPYVPSQFGDSTWWGFFQYAGDALGMPGFVGAVDTSRANLIKQGQKGDIVRTIQKIVGATVDGDFGPLTTTAVKGFQSHWLGAQAADGIIGVDTLAVMSWLWTSPR